MRNEKDLRNREDIYCKMNCQTHFLISLHGTRSKRSCVWTVKRGIHAIFLPQRDNWSPRTIIPASAQKFPFNWSWSLPCGSKCFLFVRPYFERIGWHRFSNNLPQSSLSVMFRTKIVNTLEESIEHNRNAKEHVKCDLDAHTQKPEAELDRVKLECRPENDVKPQHDLF